jgi:hypothetical protein
MGRIFQAPLDRKGDEITETDEGRNNEADQIYIKYSQY